MLARTAERLSRLLRYAFNLSDTNGFLFVGRTPGGERMIDFLLTCAAIVAFFIAITTAAGFVVVVALVIKYWREYGG